MYATITADCMARQRISEYRAKSLLFATLDLAYRGVSVDTEQEIPPQLNDLDSEAHYVVKVDQGVKKRMKRGLIALDKTVDEIPAAIATIKEKGYSQFLIEPMAAYDAAEERYFAVERVRDGYKVYVSSHGGIEIEEHEESVKTVLLPYSSSDVSSQAGEASSQEKGSSHSVRTITEEAGLSPEILEKILQAFDAHYFSFLEINPLVIHDDALMILDLAVEVDSVAEFFVSNAWTRTDFTYGERQHKTPEEIVIDELKQNSQAAFTLNVLNENGSIFMLLSGGGASLVLADEVANIGYGESLANYGEYSGNPNAEETYLYTKQVLSLLLKSDAPKKVLIVGGGVANFTDIRLTFTGVIRALEEKKDELRAHGVKVFVRRGGPNQEEGLKIMRTFLEHADLHGRVVGPDVILTDIVHDAITILK